MSTRPLRTDSAPSQAIVVGAGFAGLLAARALSEHFDRVLVLDRDEQPYPGNSRRGVPQGHHPHTLLASGQRVLDRLFPAFVREARHDGVPEIDYAEDVRWRRQGRWKARFPSRVRALLVTRPALEERVRQRVASLPNVRFAWRTRVVDLSLSDDGARVDGVWARLPDRELERLAADVVVDASGCGSTLPRTLAVRGFESPIEERVEIGLTYTSGLFRRRVRTPLDWRGLFLPPERGERRGGLAVALDSVYLQVTLQGYGGERPPVDLDGFLAYAATLGCPELEEELSSAALVSDLHRYSVPEQVRRRYERLRRLPAGLLAIGDALGRLDPAYGQGLSVAALQADALHELLARRSVRGGVSRELASEYFARAAHVFDLPWRMSGAAARVAASRGARDLLSSVLRRRYRRWLELAAAEVPAAHEAFLEVWHLLAPESKLFSPGVALRVLMHAATSRRPRRNAGRPVRREPRLETSATLRLATASDASAEIRLR